MTRPLLFSLALLALPALAHAQSAPPEGAWLRYDVRRTVHGGQAAYEGYADALVASGRYDVTALSPEAATIHGVYRWRFDSSDRHEDGSEDRTVSFALPGRRYTSDRTDLDDYDESDPTALATWLWIPTDAVVGNTLPVLERDFTVTSIEPLVVAGASREAIHLHAVGNGERRDDYGTYTTSFADDYWFDAATGMFLLEEYEEHDDGTYEGEHAAFDVTERVSIVDASYAPLVGAPPLDPLDVADRSTEVRVPRAATPRPALRLVGGGLLCGALGLGFVFFLFSRGRRRGAPTVDGKGIDVEKLAPGTPRPELPAETTSHFRPFLTHFTELAHRTSNEVVVARVGGQAHAIGFGDRDTGVGSIFAPNPEVCEQVRNALGVSEFFSEMRHGNLGSVIAATSDTATQLSSSSAYNVYETYEVLRLDAIPSGLSFDSAVVTRLREGDAAEATALLDAVLGVPCRAFLEASLALGDVGYAARVDGRIVAVALASIAGTHGRLHTLAVHPDHRAKGLGKELVRARLRALSELGATTVIAEIATWNLASLEIARAHGFVKISEMFVESARDQKVEKRLVRR